ncbi:hypothetical protein [Mycolicibacterium monacense]|uniref:VWA7 N-terminal domain-containing protein n=3 Tax=Mycobacteriaceae TaxID=1762 RepID=A0AAD1ISF2_MYCMB|nr:hypothetical protein [Mycolicibacterium monacense]MDA4102136.1 hypothetical protein [Mycolicibacterium monacense DSM 44395]OBF52346.1 hypothetical protein A5778_14490 [Mycolicibacterium monacense]ORB19956.1 hypothetical protein BST34_13360 [Mycolicibacterium monacense DSM 44395]QHP86872.1 hypothetical protein EWR22_16775 [Mycolicibacterium monacense DSM 44395]BBZ60049.1 hypothetical protein MMON_13500 [Mycolicibacterium monacense]
MSVSFTITRRLRRVPLAVLAVAGLVGGMCWSAPSAQAFYIHNHAAVTRAALPPDQVNEIAILQILNGPPPGGGAMGSDAFATDQWRHIDNAKNPGDICARAQQAWSTLSPVILRGSQPVGPGANALRDGPGARAAFGGLMHAQQDFYSHSNWVETNIAAGQPERPAPALFPACNPSAFPADLHTGYFNALYSAQFPLDGCPPAGPPPGFQECHAVLNKDGPNTARGGQPVPGTSMNMYDLAARLSTATSADLYRHVRGLIASTVSAQNPGVDGECIASKFFRPDLLGPCAKFVSPFGGPGFMPR